MPFCLQPCSCGSNPVLQFGSCISRTCRKSTSNCSDIRCLVQKHTMTSKSSGKLLSSFTESGSMSFLVNLSLLLGPMKAVFKENRHSNFPRLIFTYTSSHIKIEIFGQTFACVHSASCLHPHGFIATLAV